MIEANLIYLLIFFLIILQSIAGVGVLVIGTPILLLYDFNFIDILSILLPISISTSFLNLIFLKFNKKKLSIKIDRKLNFLFFVFCLPLIFGGLYIIKHYSEVINFKYLVSGVIFFSMIITNQKKIINQLNNNLKIFFLSLIGLIHGISNSGGSLLSLFITSNFKKNQSRYNVTYFYFYLALFQFIMYLIIFNIQIAILNYFYIFSILPLGVIFGNILAKYINENSFKIIINFLSTVTCIVLLSEA